MFAVKTEPEAAKNDNNLIPPHFLAMTSQPIPPQNLNIQLPAQYTTAAGNTVTLQHANQQTQQVQLIQQPATVIQQQTQQQLINQHAKQLLAQQTPHPPSALVGVTVSQGPPTIIYKNGPAQVAPANAVATSVSGLGNIKLVIKQQPIDPIDLLPTVPLPNHPLPIQITTQAPSMQQPGQVTVAAQAPAPTGKPSTRCDQCGNQYASNYVLERHIKAVHHKIRDLACPECEYKTSMRSHLNKHIKSVHQRLRDHNCQYCAYSSSTKSCLDRHVKIVHLKEKIKCSFCSYEASQRYRMANHIKSAHFGETLTYTCTLCDFESASRRQLTNHRKECHGLGVGGANSSVVGVKIEPGTMATVAQPIIATTSTGAHTVSLPTHPVLPNQTSQSAQPALPTQPLQAVQTIQGGTASIVALGPDGQNVLVPVSMAPTIVMGSSAAEGGKGKEVLTTAFVDGEYKEEKS